MDYKSLFNVPSPLERVTWPQKWKVDFDRRELKLFVKRDDLIHPEVSGNKWRKLYLNVQQAHHAGKKGILTFGGAFSNHLLATAFVCHKLGFQSIGIVRGEELNAQSNQNLKRCSDLGMHLIFITREEYRMKEDWEYLAEIKSEHSSYFILPEGGKNFYGIIGCQEIPAEVNKQNDLIQDFWVSIGTGTTAAGMVLGMKEDQSLFCVPSSAYFKVEEELLQLFKRQFNDEDLGRECIQKVKVVHHENIGKYGSSNQVIGEFIHEIQVEIGLPLEEIYTAKTFYGLLKFYQENDKIENRSIVFIHTGGLCNKKGQPTG